MSFRLYRQPTNGSSYISSTRLFSPTRTTPIDSLFQEEKYSSSAPPASISSANASSSAPPASISSANASSSPPASAFRDVHVYDYTYKDQEYTPLVSGDKREWIERLIPLMRNPVAIQGLHLILSNINTLNNFDTTNQKRAEDLLADIAYSIIEKKAELLDLLEEQLADMYQLGQCAQGRVTRLWQLRALL
jgi:hypothetical protein